MKPRLGRRSLLASFFIASTVVPSATAQEPEHRFRRGDVNYDGRVSIADAWHILCWLCLGASTPTCLRAADVDENGDIQISDAIAIFEYTILGGRVIPAACTSDPGGSSALSCEAADACREEPLPPPPAAFTLFVATEPDADEPPQAGVGLFGSPGQVFDVPFFVHLKGGRTGEFGTAGATGWSFGIRPRSDTVTAEIVEAAVEGTEATGLLNGGFLKAAPAEGGGAVSMFLLSFLEPRSLPPDKAIEVLRGTLRVTAPERGSDGIVWLEPADGLKGPGAEPVSLEVVWNPAGPFRPETIPLKVFVASPSGLGAFLRGDGNGDGFHDISDPIFTLGFLFLGAPAPECPDAADANDDGTVDLSDAVFSLRCLFYGTACPAPPFPGCGVDPTEDGLACDSLRFDCVE